MSYGAEKLRLIDDGTLGGLNTSKLWKYNATGETITTPGYFKADDGVAAGDIIMATTATTVGFYIISENAGVLTATFMVGGTDTVLSTSVSVNTTGMTVLTGSTLGALLTALDASLVGINSAISDLAAADVSFSATGLTHITGTDVQAAIASIDAQLGS